MLYKIQYKTLFTRDRWDDYEENGTVCLYPKDEAESMLVDFVGYYDTRIVEESEND